MVTELPAEEDRATGGPSDEVRFSVDAVSEGTTTIEALGADIDGLVTVNIVSVDISTSTEGVMNPFPSNPTGKSTTVGLVKVRSWAPSAPSSTRGMAVAPLEGRMTDLVKCELMKCLWRECIFSSIVVPSALAEVFERIVGSIRERRIV